MAGLAFFKQDSIPTAAQRQHPTVLTIPALTRHPSLLAAQGNTLYKEGQYLKAAAAYTQGLKADPAHSVLYRCCRGRADCLLGAGADCCLLLPVDRDPQPTSLLGAAHPSWLVA